MLEWNARYSVGVESIDNAHKEIFSIVNRLHKAMRTGGNSKWTASEAIKYLKSYTLKHFQDEEAYMLLIGFRDYENHKIVHDGMRDKIIPRLSSYLEVSDYSDESVESFLTICEKWLHKHILGQDRELLKYAVRDDEE